MKPADLLLTAATFISFLVAFYLFSSDPVMSNSVNWADDLQPQKNQFQPAAPEAKSVSAPMSVSVVAPAVTYPDSGLWRYIVIHHSATKQGNAAIFDSYHRKEKGMKDGLSYHFVIGNGNKSKDGQVEVGRRWKSQIAGVHCFDGKMNQQSIGICLVGNFDDARPTLRQMRALSKLLSELQSKYRIPHSNIRLHNEVDKRQTNCPGKNFPAGKIR